MSAGQLIGPNGRFLVGTCGNPGGRPKVSHGLQALARQHTLAALNALVEIVNSKKATPASRVTAACAILDRGYGRPPTLQTDEDDTLMEALQFSDEELATIVATRGGGGTAQASEGAESADRVYNVHFPPV